MLFQSAVVIRLWPSCALQLPFEAITATALLYKPTGFWPLCKGLGDCGGVSDVDLQSVSLARRDDGKLSFAS
jgi:hypothetical protein